MTGDNADATKLRVIHLLAALVTIPIGLASRHFAHMFPAWLRKPPGDVLWAAMVYFLFAAIIPKRAVAAAASFSLGIELFKLVNTPALNSMRASVAGRLIFGTTFTWANLVYYAVGIMLGVLIDRALIARETETGVVASTTTPASD